MTEVDTVYFNTNDITVRRGDPNKGRSFYYKCKQDFPAHQWAKSRPIFKQEIRGVGKEA